MTRAGTRSYATSSFTVTVFGSTYAYDIGGRRTSHTLPTNGLLGDGTISYGYEADRGVLKDVWHGTSHVQFSYDNAGRQDSLRVYKNLSGNETLGVIERRQYDYDGQLTHLARVRREGGSFTGLLTNDLTSDARVGSGDPRSRALRRMLACRHLVSRTPVPGPWWRRRSGTRSAGRRSSSGRRRWVRCIGHVPTSGAR